VSQISPDPKFTTAREFSTRIRDDGGAETHVHVDCTLADVAAATNLRPEDAAFALNEIGLLVKRMSKTKDKVDHEVIVNGDTPSEQGTGSETGGGDDDEAEEDEDDSNIVVITRQMVERIASERSIKRAVLDLNCVIDPPPPPPSET
jgi:histone acetyltransferase HTATIP/histone acetyltransferase MYST1